MSLLIAGATALGGAIQAGLGYKGQKKTNEKNMELAKYQYSKDLEMWNKGNAYNSPEAQMQRLKDAGLNPNLVYGQGAVGNSSGQLPKYNAPTVDYNYQPPVAQTANSTISQYQDFQIKQAQANNLREQGKAIAEEVKIRSFKNWLNEVTAQSQADRWGLQNRGLNLTNTGKEQSNFWNPIKWKAGVENMEERTEATQWNNALFGDTYNERVGIFSNKYKQGVQDLATGRINQRAKQQAIKMMEQKYGQSNELFPYQLQFQRGKLGEQSQNIQNMMQSKEFMQTKQEMEQLKIDTYMYQIYGNFAEKAMRQINQMNQGYKGHTPKAKEMTPPWRGTLKTNPRSRRIPSKGAVNP